MQTKRLFTWMLIMMSVVLGAATAQANLLTNGSFESGYPIPSEGYLTINAVNYTITDWVVASSSVDYISTYWPASAGHRSLDLNGTEAGIITTSFTTTPNTGYRVTFDLAGNPGSAADKLLEVSAAGQSQTFTFIQDGYTTDNMGWTSKTFYFLANDSSTTLQFKSLSPTGWGPALDNVDVAVPVPPTLLLLGSGLAGLGLLRRKWSLKR